MPHEIFEAYKRKAVDVLIARIRIGWYTIEELNEVSESLITCKNLRKLQDIIDALGWDVESPWTMPLIYTAILSILRSGVHPTSDWAWRSYYASCAWAWGTVKEPQFLLCPWPRGIENDGSLSRIYEQLIKGEFTVIIPCDIADAFENAKNLV
ncbi:MAG TPA: hypothetical protein PKN48_01020 [Bacteroidales bacterium]|nr:hypothetical protein [Bacteroidales bacterium]